MDPQISKSYLALFRSIFIYVISPSAIEPTPDFTNGPTNSDLRPSGHDDPAIGVIGIVIVLDAGTDPK